MGRNNTGKQRSGPREVRIPITKQILYHGVQVEVQNLKDGGRQLAIFEVAAGTMHLFPLDAEASRTIGNALSSAVPIAHVDQMPGTKAA